MKDLAVLLQEEREEEHFPAKGHSALRERKCGWGSGERTSHCRVSGSGRFFPSAKRAIAGAALFLWVSMLFLSGSGMLLAQPLLAQGKVSSRPAFVPGRQSLASPLSFTGYEGRMAIWQGELPVVGAPVRLALDGRGGGILTITNPQTGAQESVGITISSGAGAGTGTPLATASGTVDVGVVFLGKSPDGKLIFGVVVDGRIVEILLIDPVTKRVVRRISF
ncbi:MAG: hypothetical protein KatS3mg119_0005 [Rhodothalassiaceae bacterium]|nr:MAG: hypothetical protein KatS3mg119_0005 [Rhodothalassiaceae bacterium]